MSLIAAIVSLLCGVLWAGLDAARKGLAQRVPALVLLAALTAAQVPVFFVWLAFERPLVVDPHYFAAGGAVVLLNIFALWLLIRALAIAPLSLTIPLLSLTPALTAAASVPLLGELPSLAQAAGIFAVVFGALLLSGVDTTAELDEAQRSRMQRDALKGRLMMVGVSVLWAITGPLDKIALGYASLPFHALVISAGIAAGLTLFLLARRRLTSFAALRPRLPLFFVAAALGAAALGAQLLAIQLTLVSLVEAIKRALGMVIAVVNGRIFFAERITWRKVMAVLLMSAGVVLLLVLP